jgi:exonuclease VII small subunit
MISFLFLGDKMNVEFIGQLVDSMEEGVLRLEQAVKKKDTETANRLRVFIFDVHKKISEALRS